MLEHAPLIIDVAGTSLSADDRRRLAHPLVGGLILFTRNWENRAQLLALCQAIKRVRGDLLIAIDHEGGRVQRFRTDGFTALPAMRTLGEMWDDDGKAGQPGTGAMRAQNAATATGFVLASELRACGVDFSFTPVLDLDWGDSQVIGDRAFHGDARVVSVLAKSLMLGLLQAGMGNCGKHFPGHGFVTADSHVALPVDQRALKDILADDAMPYAWLQTALTAVMPAHVIYSRVDKRPAGFSPRWLQAVLRGRLGYEGAIFSDDLSMAAARQLDGRQLSYAQSALEALRAGCDFALVCNQTLQGATVLDELIDQVAQAVVQGEWQPSRASAMRRQALLPAGVAPDWDSLMVSPRYLQALALMP